MASKKRASEGIALLSMYGDEEDEMEDVEEQDADIQKVEIHEPSFDATTEKFDDDVSGHGNQNTSQQLEARGFSDSFSPFKLFVNGTAFTTASPGNPFVSPGLQPQTVATELNFVQFQKNRLTIVDYGHEEGAMSPETEDGEIVATGRVMYGEQLQIIDGEFRENRSPGSTQFPTPTTIAKPTQSQEPVDIPESNGTNDTINAESAETEDIVMVSVEEQKDAVLLNKFLPPPQKIKCSEELQEKIVKFLALKKTTGRSFNSEVRNRKEYRNPDFLLHAVTYQGIDEVGSCFSKDVFDPHGYDKSDFYDEIDVEMIWRVFMVNKRS